MVGMSDNFNIGQDRRERPVCMCSKLEVILLCWYKEQFFEHEQVQIAGIAASSIVWYGETYLGPILLFLHSGRDTQSRPRPTTSPSVNGNLD